MTARGLEAEAKAKGAAAVVIKPVEPKAFLELVKQVLEAGGA